MWDKILSVVVPIAGKIVLAAVVLIVGHIIIKGIKKLLHNNKGLQKIDSTIRSFLLSFINAALYCILIISVIAILGIPMASIVAVLASAGLAIGLALQGALSNFAGGIMIILFKPFNVGDYISSGGNEGTVKGISLFYTTIVTLDGKKITIPNSSITSGTVTNFTSEGIRRVDIKIGVAYGTDVEAVKAAFMELLSSHPLALKSPAPFVRLSDHLDSALEFTLRAWCRQENYWDLYFDMVEGVNRVLKEKNIEIPFPQLDVHMDK